MNIDKVLKLHGIGDKMGMAMKRRMVDDEMNPGESRDALKRRVRDAVRTEDWEGAAAGISILWFQDWCNHLGRDFTLCGGEPEHAVTMTLVKEDDGSGGNVVRFSKPN